jgi:DnaK suppressor protein
MTKKQLSQRIERILIRRRDALRQTLSGELGQFNTFEERFVGDSVDVALDTNYRVINSELAEFESRELAQIQRALERLREGRYGVCEGCGKNIPMVRLEALPYATMCIQCQTLCEHGSSAGPLEEDWSRVDEASDSLDQLTLDTFDFAA